MPQLLTPYVVSRTTEKVGRMSELRIEHTASGPRLAYQDMRPEDRDQHGNLWIRYKGSPDGRAVYNSVHPARQRACMEQMLCQVCAQPADRNDQGWLFIDWRREDSPPTWPERSITGMPPLCVEHARRSLEQCPFLRGSEHAVLRVRKPHLYGVSGTLYRWGPRGWVASDEDYLSAYSKPRFPCMLASRLHRELRHVTVVNLP